MAVDRWGLLVLDKPPGLTSHTAVQRVRRALGAKRAGHAGTLDPSATGVLLVALGRATRLLEYLTGHDKSYRAVVRLGECRDTLDREGTLLETRPVPDFSPEVVETALEGLRGSFLQTPPVYSAIKVRGVPLHRRARRGEDVRPEPRPVTLHRLELVERRNKELVLDLTCSAGTYVRSLARDLGDVLGTGAILWELARTRSGDFDLAEARSLAEVEAAGESAWGWVHAPERMVAALQRVHLGPEDTHALAAGRRVEPPATRGTVAVFDDTGHLVAVAEAADDALRPTKVFRAV